MKKGTPGKLVISLHCGSRLLRIFFSVHYIECYVALTFAWLIYDNIVDSLVSFVSQQTENQ